MVFVEISGWVGSACAFLAWYWVSKRGSEPEGVAYQLWSLGAGLFLSVNFFFKGAWGPLALQFFWGIWVVKILIRHYKVARQSHVFLKDTYPQ